jgi:hypothetical protein
MKYIRGVVSRRVGEGAPNILERGPFAPPPSKKKKKNIFKILR